MPCRNTEPDQLTSAVEDTTFRITAFDADFAVRAGEADCGRE
jgi:hypothetical protein